MFTTTREKSVITWEFPFSAREILLLLHAKICKIRYFARICTHCTHLHACATGKNWCPTPWDPSPSHLLRAGTVSEIHSNYFHKYNTFQFVRVLCAFISFGCKWCAVYGIPAPGSSHRLTALTVVEIPRLHKLHASFPAISSLLSYY